MPTARAGRGGGRTQTPVGTTRTVQRSLYYAESISATVTVHELWKKTLYLSATRRVRRSSVKRSGVFFWCHIHDRDRTVAVSNSRPPSPVSSLGAGLRAVFPCANLAEQAQDAEGDPKRDRAESCGQAPGKRLMPTSLQNQGVFVPLATMADSWRGNNLGWYSHPLFLWLPPSPPIFVPHFDPTKHCCTMSVLTE